MIAPGTVLQNRYVIDRVIDHGGMGSVYLARQLSLNDRPVAIKQMSMPLGVDAEQAAAQFRQEAATLAALRHPNLVSVHDFFSEGAEHFLVMEYVEGSTLETEVQRRDDVFEIDRVVAWGLQLCDVLGYLHGQRPPIIFRDLKPSNVILDVLGHLRLIDFGIARTLQLQSTTATFVIGAGTPGYAAPEQYGTSHPDNRCDVYSLGGTLYTLLTLRTPCDAIDRVLGRATLAPPASINPQIPARLAAVVERMMSVLPDQRYSSMADVSQALASVTAAPVGLRSSPGGGAPRLAVDAPPAPTVPRSVRATAAVLVLVFGLWRVATWHHEPPRRVAMDRTGTALPQASATLATFSPPSPAVSATPAPKSTPMPRSTPKPRPSPTAAAFAQTPVAASPNLNPKGSWLPGQVSNADIVATDSGLMYQEIRVGDGAVPKDGDAVQVHYTGWLMNGTRVAASVDQPLTFALGRGEVIKGWEEGVSTMHVGGQRKLIIPASLAYGDTGAPGVPPGATLILDVELLSAETPPPPR